MNIKDYATKALETDYRDYSNFHTGDSSPRLDYATMGLVTEAAKILNLIKKTKKRLSPLDRQALLEELGDLLWYLNLTINELGFSFDDVMNENLTKIHRKYLAEDSHKKELVRGSIR